MAGVWDRRDLPSLPFQRVCDSSHCGFYGGLSTWDFFIFLLFHVVKLSCELQLRYYLLFEMFAYSFLVCVCAYSATSVSLWPPRTVACQAPLSVGFPRQEYWSGLSFPSPGDLIEPGSPALQADSLPSEPPGEQVTFFFYSLITFNLSYLWYVCVWLS